MSKETVSKDYKQPDTPSILRVKGVMAKGYGLLPKVAMLDPELPIISKAIYALLCSHLGQGNNTVFPGRDSIVHYLGITKDTYYKYFEYLKEQGYIEVNQAKGTDDKKFSHNIYFINPSPIKYKKQIADRIKKLPKDSIHTDGMNALGYGYIAKLVMTDSRLPSQSKAIYSYFAVFADKENIALPKVSDILYHLQISENTYYKYFNILVELNYITVKQNLVDGVFSHNIYCLISKPQPTKVQVPDKRIDKESSSSLNLSDTVLDSPSLNLSDTVLDSPSLNLPDINLSYINLSYLNLSDANNPKENNPSIINPSINQSIKKSDRLIEKENKAFVLSQLIENSAIPGLYPKTKSHIVLMVHLLTGYNRNINNNTKEDIYSTANKLFVNALIDMLGIQETETLAGRVVTAFEISEKLGEYIEFKDDVYSISSLKEVAIKDYINACSEKEIKYKLKYMMACIWNAMLKGKADLFAEAARIERPDSWMDPEIKRIIEKNNRMGHPTSSRMLAEYNVGYDREKDEYYPLEKKNDNEDILFV